MRKLWIVAGLCTALLAACGGSDTITGETTGTTPPPTPVTASSLTATSSVASILSDGSTTATITVLARNSTNNLVSGVVVEFSANSGGIAVTNGTTNSSGAAVAVLSTAGDATPRTITVTATSGTLKATVNVVVVSGSTASTSAVATLKTTSSAASILSDGSTTATISALALDGANNALAGVPVSFAASSGAIAVTQATTDATGTATGTLSTAGDSTLRTITVTATSGTLSSTVSVPVVAAPATPVYSMGNGTGTAGFTKGVISIAVPGISAGGETGFSLTIVDQTDTLYSAKPVVVSFSSPCIAAGTAKIYALGSTTAVTSLTTSTGSLSGTYDASGCSGADALAATATVGAQNITATGTINVSPSSVGSIQFTSATPTTIGLKGTGLGETSTLIFTVSDSTGAPKSGVTVSFAPDTSVGGLSLTPTSAVSGSDGTVQTVVSAGTVHTVVRVTASIASPALSTQSSQLTISTGLPTSNAFSTAVGTPSYHGLSGASSNLPACSNVEAYDIDGLTVPITVFLADRYGNPVPDNTSVAFVTNGGIIDGSCTTGPGGTGECTVNWTSANPRPKTTDTPPVLRNGVATILATAIGEESFTDVNGSGFYQIGDAFSNLGEPFLSANESTDYISGDYYLDYNGNGKYDGPSGSFIGITCTGTSPASTCTTNTLAISASHLLIMSTSDADVSLVYTSPEITVSHPNNVTTFSIVEGTSGSFTVNVLDLNGNSMAAGTTITTAATIGTATQAPTTITIACDSTGNGQDVIVSYTAPTTPGQGVITVTVGSPSAGPNGGHAFTIPVIVTAM